MNHFVTLAVLCFAARAFSADGVLFRDDFAGKLDKGWSFVRENPAAWRVTGNALQVRIEPGNMWGPQNTGKNILWREAPDVSAREVEISVTVSNRPTAQYEQVDLVWYYNDSNMVKIGLELVNGQLSIVMGREENDRTRTINVIPNEAFQVELRHRVKGTNIWGEYRAVGSDAWRQAGHCDLPVHGTPKLALQCYQGPANAEHWATITNFTVRAIAP